MSVIDNLNLRSFDRDASGKPSFWLDRSGMAARARDMIAGYRVRAPSPEVPIGVLSGGNVQRCVLARELDGKVMLLVLFTNRVKHKTIATAFTAARPPSFPCSVPRQPETTYEKTPPAPNPNNAIEIAMNAKW